jgi:ribosome-binding factor A
MHRSERLEEQLREEIIQLVEYELDDPRLTPVTITDLKLSENHRDAKVFFAVTGSEQEAAAALAALRKETTGPDLESQTCARYTLRKGQAGRESCKS